MSRDQHQEDKNQKRKKSVIFWGVVLVIIVLAVAGVIYCYINQKINKLNQTEIAPDKIEKNELQEEEEAVMEGYTNIAVFGIDNRTTGNYNTGNSDTIMLASINHDTKEVKLVSVYRDTYLRIDRDGYYGKANAAYSYGGAAAGLSMLNTNFDLNLDQYIAVDWYAVVDAVDLLGGVTIDISNEERQMINKYTPEVAQVTGIQTSRVTESGMVQLDGVQAMAYARIRKLAGNDYRRTQRQRILIEAMFDKAKDADLGTLNAILDEIFPMVETNLQLKDLISLAMSAGKYKIISTTGFPFEKTTVKLRYVGDCVVPVTLEKNVQALHEYLFGESQKEVSTEVKEINRNIIEKTGMDEEHAYIDKDSYTTGL